MKRGRPATPLLTPLSYGLGLFLFFLLLTPWDVQAQAGVCMPDKKDAVSPREAVGLIGSEWVRESEGLAGKVVAGPLFLSDLAAPIEKTALPRRSREWLEEDNAGAQLLFIRNSIEFAGGTTILGSLHALRPGEPARTILVINGNLDLRGIVVCGALDLDGLIVRGDILLAEAYLRDGLVMSNVLVEGDFHLHAATLAQQILLKDVVVVGQTDITCWREIGEPLRLRIDSSEFNEQFSLGDHGCREEKTRKLNELSITNSRFHAPIRTLFQRLEVAGTAFLFNTEFRSKQTQFLDLDLKSGLTSQQVRFANSILFENGQGQSWPFMDFSGSRFGENKTDKVAFRGISVKGSANFRKLNLNGTLELRGGLWGLVDLSGSRGSGSVIVEATALNGLRLSDVELGAVVVRNVKLGFEDDCAPDSLIALDLLAATLQAADLSHIVLYGNLNLARFAVPFERFQFDWQQMYSHLRAAESRVGEVGSCAGRRMIIAAEDNRPDKIEALAGIEAALRHRGRVYEANEAYFEMNCLEESTDAQCRALVSWSWIFVPIGDAISACVSLRWEDCGWGYGVRPWRLVVWLVILNLIGSFILFWCPRNIVSSKGMATWRPQPRGIANVGPTTVKPENALQGGKRYWGCLVVATQAITSVLVAQKCIEAPNDSAWVKFLWAIRILGVVLIAALVISVARAWPWLYNIVKVILGVFS